MKTKNMIWAALSMTAALVMTACTNDDNMVDSPAVPQAEVKTIPYSVTVNDAATTRATVDADLQTLKFAAGDQLYISSDSRSDLKGTLTLKSGDEGKSSGATFEGTLSYMGDAPATDLAIKATLVGSSNVGVQIAEDKVTGINYPTAAYCSDVNDAVQKYSNLTGSSTYGEKSFTLTQQTAFLNFVITFDDGTTTGTELSAVVSNSGSAIATANVTTTTESEKVVAKFVLPVAKGTVLSSANVKMGAKEAISFGASQTLDGKVYNVKKTQAPAARKLAEATAADLGKIAGADGNIYDDAAAAEAAGTTAVAMIAYVGSDAETSTTYNHGLALALSDVSGYQTWCSQYSETCLSNQYSDESDAKADMAGLANTDALVSHTTHTHTAANAARNYNSGTHPTGTSAWFLPSAGQWDKMATAAGGYANLKTNAGLETSNVYLSSSEIDAERAWGLDAGDAYWFGGWKDLDYLVRACLAF